MANEISGSLDGENLHIGLVVSLFNETITARLLMGARQAADVYGVREENLTIVYVPGSFELPATASRMLQNSQWDALIALGCVIRGETAHFDLVASEAAHGLAEVGRKSAIPVIFGVITTENMDQALSRSGGLSGNKGFDSMESAIKMASLYRELDAFSISNTDQG